MADENTLERLQAIVDHTQISLKGAEILFENSSDDKRLKYCNNAVQNLMRFYNDVALILRPELKSTRSYLEPIKQLMDALEDHSTGAKPPALLKRTTGSKTPIAKARKWINALLAVELLVLGGVKRTVAQDLAAEKIVAAGLRSAGFGSTELASFRQGHRDFQSEAWRPHREVFESQWNFFRDLNSEDAKNLGEHLLLQI